MKTLLERIAYFENLSEAFKECSRGKRKSLGYQEALFAHGERLKVLEDELFHHHFNWSGYRSFFVHDPKTREVMSAPFMDRVVHHAIHRAIEPIVDPHLSDSVFACRKSKGNRNAVLCLWKGLKVLGADRFCIKLDVSKYFASINHQVLLSKLLSLLPDSSLEPLLTGIKPRL